MAVRSAYFANHLCEKGHKVDVLTINPSRKLHVYDDELSSIVLPQVRVYRTYAGLLHHIRYGCDNLFSKKIYGMPGSRGFLAWYQTMLVKFFFPLVGAEWLFYGMFWGIILCCRNKYDAIYSHGNPFISNVVPYMLRKIFRVPWLNYISDPRYFGVFSQGRRISKTLEDRFLNNSDKIIVNCPEMIDGYMKYFPRLDRDRFVVITDGFSRVRYDSIEPEKSGRFRMVYTGAFYTELREPYELFYALSELKQMDIEFLASGVIPDKYRDFIRDNNLEDVVTILESQPLKRVVALQKGATVNVNLGWPGGYQLPGKLFEYIGARRPIMAVRNDDRDIGSKYVIRYKRGISVANNRGQICRAVKELYELWERGELESAFDLGDIEEFEWSNLTDRLEKAILDVA